MKANGNTKDNSKQTQKVKILVADDDKDKLPYLIASLIQCDDDTISIDKRKTLIEACFELKFTTSYIDVEKLISDKKNPFIPDIALLDVNFEKNRTILKGDKESEDLRYKGIDLAELIKKKSLNTKVILNTGYADHKEWKEKFKEKKFVVKSEYSSLDPHNTIYRKEKNANDDNADGLTHLIKPILNDFAINIYKSLIPASKRGITLLLKSFNKKSYTKEKINVEVNKITITTNTGISYLLKDICHFDAHIERVNSSVELIHFNLSNALNSVVTDANDIKNEDYPSGNGPWVCKEIQVAFVEHFGTDKEKRIKEIKNMAKGLTKGFFSPLLLNVKFSEHGYKGKFSLEIYKNDTSKISDNPDNFLKALKNNVTLRITAQLCANICKEKNLQRIYENNKDVFRLHKKAFKIYIDTNPEKFIIKSDDYDPEHSKVTSLITTRLGLSYSEDEGSYKLSDLCGIEKDVYNELYNDLIAELSL